MYYTGLSTWELLQKLFIYVRPYLKQRSSLSPFQQLLITLMRLRLNLCGQDLGYRFKVHASTICRTFEFVINLLYAKLKPLIIRPTIQMLSIKRDAVLADRGFDRSDSVGSYCSTLKIPAFTRGKSQLSGIEAEETRKIANVRIHVERVIGNIRKKFSLLSLLTF